MASVKNPKSKVLRVIWAVDPFAENKQMIRLSISAIRAWSRKRAITIEPVYVSGTELFKTSARLPTGAATELRATAQIALDRALRELDVRSILPLRVIAQSSVSLRDNAEALVDYARAVRGDLIALGTHSKKGLKRWFLGSFAETLVLHCDLPMLVVNPKWKCKDACENIVFPTDFSDQSYAAFNKVVAMAKSTGAKVTLHHRFRYDLPISLDGAIQAAQVYARAYEDELVGRRFEANRWIRRARSAGVRAKAVVDARGPSSVSQSIVRQSNREPGLIAMVSHSGAISSAILGSSTRAVLREASSPVWILHPGAKTTKQLKEEARAPLFTVTQDEIEDQLFKRS